MFELQRSSVFFEQMSLVHPTIVQNIEIVQENKTALDISYHQPKHFILALNNLLRSLLFFIEFSKKNSPEWLKKAVCSFIVNNAANYQKLNYLRNVSAHQNLIVPEESLVSGLYRIKSARNYTLKLGLGDHNKPGKYAFDIALKDTCEIFHDLLSYSSIAFMDLEHSALYECLGITRRWFFKVKFKAGTTRYNEVIDVYQLASSFSAALLDEVCNAYATHVDVVFDMTFAMKLEDHNFINTLLEIDLFPELFTEWWEEEHEPLNFGVKHEIFEGQKHEAINKFHRWVFDNLSPDIHEYRASLMHFSILKPEEVINEENLRNFLSFIITNHWHYKNVFTEVFNNPIITSSDVMQLQRLGNIFLEESHKRKLCTIASSKDSLNLHIQKMIVQIDQNLLKNNG